MPALVLSSTRSPPRVSSPEPTNTLILASLPPSFFHPSILNILRGYFAEFGDLHTFAPLRAFGRAIIVYYENDAAEEGKLNLDDLLTDRSLYSAKVVLRVYRAGPTPIPVHDDYSDPNAPHRKDPYHLAPPSTEKNFLISPPGSPPVGWEQMKEDPPNATPLADDLIAALARLQAEQDLRGGMSRRTSDGRSEVLWHANETAAGVGVYVEDCERIEMQPVFIGVDDEDDEPRWTYGVTDECPPKPIIPRTVMPPRVCA
ncbi:Calcipressin [Hysterangium stoloniferum]|nr:Calcipressin [Hysterangium stoloniferum]